jgi:hypothetical protein
MAYTFGAEEILTALGVTAEDFEVHESGNDEQSDSNVVTDNVGANIAASEVRHNIRNEKTVTLHAKNPDGATATFNLGGAGTSGVVITRAVARQVNNAEATLAVTAHAHDGAAEGDHNASPLDQAVTTPSLGFGVLAIQFDGVSGGTLEDCQSSEITWEVEHVDKQNNLGNHLIGASTGLRVECSEEYVDSGSDITVPDPWKQDSQQKRTVNTDFYTRTVRAHKFAV